MYCWTYESGELFCGSVDLGLPLPVRCAGTIGVAEAEARPAGDFGAAEGAISTYDDRSCGAGDGAIAMAVLMIPILFEINRCVMTSVARQITSSRAPSPSFRPDFVSCLRPV